MKRLICGLIIAIFLGSGCGEDTRLDFKLTGLTVRNIRDRYLAAELKFDRTLRSIVPEDGIKATVRIDPVAGGSPLEQVREKVSGLQLEDPVLFSGADSFQPADYYRAFVRLEREGKFLCEGDFLLENGIGRAVDRDEFIAALPPGRSGE